MLQEMAWRPSPLTSVATALFILLFFVITLGMAALGIHSSEEPGKRLFFAAAIVLMMPPVVTSFMVLRRVRVLYADFSPKGKLGRGESGRP